MEKFKDLIQSEKPVLVDFFATWCGPCKTMRPVIESLRKEMAGKAQVVEMDVDRYDGTALFYRIQMVPTFIIFKKGEMLWRHSGLISGKELQSALEQYL